MNSESILKPIERFLEVIKGSEYEDKALQMKKEIEYEIENYNVQLKADGAYEEYLSAKED